MKEKMKSIDKRRVLAPRAGKDQEIYNLFLPTVQLADAQFYTGYDPAFLLKKTAILFRLISYPEAARTFMSETDGDASVLNSDYFDALVAEIHCAVFHQIEALIALLLAEYQTWPDWVYLAKYHTSEITKAGEAFSKGNYSAISKERHKTAGEFVRAAVYAGWQPENNADWERSLSDIAWFIGHSADEFLAAPEYYAYKHGLRVVAGPSSLAVKLLSAKDDEYKTLINKHNAISFLEITKVADGIQGQLVTKQISPRYSQTMIEYATGILDIIRQMRLARARGETPENIIVAKIDRDQLLGMKPRSRHSSSY